MLNFTVEKFIEISILLSKPMELERLYEVILKESMNTTNCDGGTLYTLGDDGLEYQYVITKSLGVELTPSTGARQMPPVPRDKQYVAGYCAITRKTLNIRDVYYASQYNFEGSRKFDAEHNYRTTSMLVVPLVFDDDQVLGVLQLINAMDENGKPTQFTFKEERFATGMASMMSLKLSTMKKKKIRR